MDEDGTIGVDTPVLETDVGRRIIWLAFAVVWFLIAGGFFFLDRPWPGVANVLLGLGAVWRSFHPG